MVELRTTKGTGAERAVLDDAALAEFRGSLRGSLLLQSDAEYETARQVWNGLIDRRPALIVRCAGAGDVINAVNLARTRELLLSVRGGGHNVAGSAVCDGALMIDLSLMKGVHVDARARTARAQGGVTWGDLDSETQVFGLATPGGAVSTTGIGGLTLGWAGCAASTASVATIFSPLTSSPPTVGCARSVPRRIPTCSGPFRGAAATSVSSLPSNTGCIPSVRSS